MNLWENTARLEAIARKMTQDLDLIQDLRQEMSIYLWLNKDAGHTDSYMLQGAMNCAKHKVLRNGKSIDSPKRKNMSGPALTGYYIEGPINAKIDLDRLEKNLTGTDAKIFSLLRNGFQNNEIAQALHVSAPYISKRKKMLVNYL